MQSTKIKTLLIYKYLRKYSDKDNPLSSHQLIEILNKDGVVCERKSIYADVKALNEIGIRIESVLSPKRGFYLASRDFETPEVRLLVDAVKSAGFITPQMTRSLTSKLKGLLSENQANSLSSQVYRDDVNKCDNENIYKFIDLLDKAISSKKKVTIKYRTRKIDKENRKSFTTKIFVVSPYALIWKDDRYYLVCNKSTHDNLMNLRLDRIREITVLEDTARPVHECSEYDVFDAADYSSKMFNMFSGKVENVTLRCHLDLREQILDRFGSNIPLVAVDIQHFETNVKVAVSDGFVSWIMQFGDKIKVIRPNHLADSVSSKAKKIASVYEEKGKGATYC